MGRTKAKRKHQASSTATAELPAKTAKNPRQAAEYMHRERHLTDLWALLEHGKFALVKGTGGSGKTTLVHQLAEERNLTLHTIQLNDQLDSKVLFGSYHCTEVPGEFCWKLSDFAKACHLDTTLMPLKYLQFLQKECVILLEDLDAASPDLVAEVFNLAERREYALPNGSGSTLHSGCRIVATVKSDKDKAETNTLLRSCPFVVELPPFTEQEMETMISVKYPQAAAAKKTILEIFKSVASSINVLPSSERRLTPTDLFRACARLERLPDLSDNTEVFHELSDCWILHLTRAETQLEMALLIGGPLSISAEHVKYLMRLRMPEVSQKEDCVQYGRSTLRRQDQAHNRKTRAYGLTKDYCQLMERTAKCIACDEPVLLTGETGVGKTTVLSMMALYTNTRLQVVNLSQDSDTSDLIGGYKPVAMINMLKPLANDYSQLFTRCFDKEKNSKFFEHLNSCLSSGRFADYLRLVVETGVRAINLKKEPTEWARLIVRAQRLLKSLSGRGSALPFAYVRGVVAEAAELGHWLLVDEINLASAECLNAILNVLDGSMPRHANFRLFACMNPATDAGKQKLPVGVRSKFTEFFVNEPSEPEQLSVIVKNYLPAISTTHLQQIVQFYSEILILLPRKFSLRNLCRAAVFACDNIYGNSFRSLYEGLVIAFTSNLDNDSRQKVLALVERYFGKAPKDKAVLPSEKRDRFIEIEDVFIEKGHRIEEDPEYVYTPSISSNLARVAAAVASGRFPVLLEGETSAGKTSMIVHLAKITGNRVFRINNHEHTDIQEYIGGYAPDENGKLTFIEGVLLKAVKNGDWIILDELNLAAAEVLEALNRLLDDNRELFVAELNVTVTAHRQFRLFATQNPVGSYAGRKRLSRAFLNRFLVLHFDPPPFSELSQIVEKRCAVPPSASKKMIDVLAELKSRRAISGIFTATDGLMTLRDLFRWGNRLRTSQNGDWQQVLADQGYFLLGTRCRNKQDEVTVIEVLEKVLKRRVDVEKLFATDSQYLPGDLDPGRVVMTLDMRRMLVLCSEAWKCDEPVLFVGETGCGKTTAAHLLSKGCLLSINCHERTETSDLLGSIRPLSDGTFQWQDGVIVQAMKTGEKILIDEISLAADSVLERLNPILESARTVLLTDAGAGSDTVKAAAGFQVVATMNPGGDHGKKELSKALRNRFTEVWCTAHYENQDVEAVICNRLRKETRIEPQQCSVVAIAFRRFFTYFAGTFGVLFRSSLSMRDVVMMTESFVSCHNNLRIPVAESVYHAIAANLFDAFELLPARVTFDSDEVTRTCLKELHDIFKDVGLLADASTTDCSSYSSAYYMLVTPAHMGLCVGPFRIPRGPLPPSEVLFSFNAPTARRNIFRVARAFASSKPIMLEGSPGAGKSSLVVALAAATGNRLVRLNLSDQTDLSDLFGSDVPVITTDGRTSFAWKDGPVLRAIKNGYWVLLDEMNLASQSVLEGLNSCFDFRKKLFIAELNKTFEIEPTSCRFFACQNPQKQGGDRRALPKSFLNRFTSIAVNEMTDEDFVFVLQKALRGRFDKDTIHNMVEVNKRVVASHIREGGPFEFNLRDLLRWSEAAARFDDLSLAYELTYVSRCRTKDERAKVREIYKTVLSDEAWCPPVPLIDKADGCLCFGPVQLRLLSERRAAARNDIRFLASQTSVLQKLAACASMNWLALLVGACHVGKRSTLEGLATAVGARLKTLRLTPETDALELLGTYEQVTDVVEFRRYQKELITTLNKSNDLTESKSLLNEARACESALDLCILAQQALQLATEDETRKRLESIVHVLSNNSIRFEWIDSPFVQAYLQGDWILIQDVNCCSAAVLDRLNTCLEKDGELVVPERTQDQTIPLPRHPNFRVFFAMDPRNGPLSRAMRNRSVEIFMGDEESWNKNAVDSLSIVLGPNNAVLDVVSEEGQQELLGAVERLGAKEKLQLNSLAPSKDASEWMTRVKSLTRPLAQSITTEVMDISDAIEDVTTTGPSQTILAVPRPTLANGCSELAEYYWKCWSAVSRLCADPASAFFFAALFAENADKFASDKCFANIDASFKQAVLAAVAELTFVQRIRPFQKGERKITGTELDIISRRLLLHWAQHRLSAEPHEEGSLLKYAEFFDKKAIRMNQLPSTAVPAVAAFVNVIPTLLAIGSLPNAKHLHGLPLVHNLIVFHFFSAQTLSEKLGIALLAHIYRTMVEGGMLSGLVGAKLSGIVKKLDDHFTTQPGVYNQLPCGKLNFCRPLTDVEEAATIEQLTLLEAEPTSLANSSVSVASEALAFLQALVDVADTLCTRSFEHCRSLSALPWTDINAKRFCLTIDYLNTFVMGINNKPAAIPTQPFVLNSVLKLWSQIAFRVDMWHVPLKELSETAKSLRSYHNLLWNVSFMQSGLRRQFETIRKEIRSFMSLAELQIPCPKDDADDEDEFWLAALGSSIKLLAALTLPRQMIDPAIENEVKLTYLQKKLDLVDSQLEALGRFLQLVVGDYAEESLRQAGHPLLRALFTTKQSLTAELAKLQESVTIAYRPKYAKYEKLVDALNNFTSQVTACASENCIVTRSDARSLLQNNEADLRRIHSQLASIGKSAAAFKSQLIRGYYEYPDLITPYITGLNVFRTAASHFAQRIEYLLHQRRLHPALRAIAQNGIRNAMHDPALTAWMISSESPLPLKLQLALVERQIAQGDIPRAIVWLEEKWNVWHEQHSEKREKMFVYKRTGQSNADDEEMMDPEEEELRALLPNYSEVSLDDLTAEPTGPLVDELDTEDLHRLLMSLAVPEKKTSLPFPYTSYLRLLSDLADTGLVTAKDDEQLSYYHMMESKRLVDAVGHPASSATHSSTRTLNVYAENDTAEVLRCVAAINDLRRRVRQLLEEYPENVVLADINAAVDKFLEASSSSPQMRLASLLEKVLELSEEWQKIADRAHSIRDELLVLQEILLSWRKMEVLCWSNILERVEADSVQLTVLTSWPLVASLKDAIASVDQWTPETEAKLLAALVDWVHSSTFLDFHARLRSGQLLARFAEIWSADGFAGKVRCVLRHYEQFSPLITEKLQRYRGEVDQKLKNFVDVAKYTDLNLWSVKHSAEKAHRQLLSIVKSFKSQCNEAVLPLLLDELMPLPASPPPSYDDLEEVEVESPGDTLSSKMASMRSRLANALSLPQLPKVELLSGMATELLSTLKQDVVYVGEDDEQKEKQQGRALFDRQKQFALVVKTANECGLSSRRGLAVNSERLTQQLLSEIVADKLSRKHPKTEALTRLAASARNVVQKLLATANMHLQEHIQKQVSVQTIGHLRGITEYGLHWLHSAVTFADRIAGVSEAFRELSDALDICAENYKGGYKTLNHRVLTAHYAQWRQLHEETSSLVTFMSQVVAACPSGETEDDDVRQKLTSCRQIQGTLGPLTKDSDAYAHLTSALAGATHLFSKSGDELQAMERCGGFWRGEQAVTFVKVVKKLSHELSAVASDGDIASAFPEQSSRLTDIAVLLSDLTIIQPLETMAERYPTFSAADALVVLQDFYKKVVAKVHEAEQKPMDAMKCLVELVNSTGWSTIIASIETVQRSLTDHVLESEDLLRARNLACGLSDILEFIIERVVLFLDWFATFYLNFESVSAHLLRKGFVNPIPKVDNSAEGQGKEMDGVGDENCGMGEGEGAKDVSEEIEESGQLEGLKGDDEQQADGRSEPMKDSEKPIEMEEDFAADLENIDADDNDKGDDDNEEGGEENADWNVGDVEEPEDRQLDPELWEKPKEDSQRNIDEENKGAQNETDDMTAKEEESNAVKDQEQAEKPNAEGHEQEETKDVDGEELDAMENVNEINLDDADSDHEENIEQHQDTHDEEAADGEAPEDGEGSPELAEQDADDAEERTSDDEKSQEEESIDATAQEQMDEDKEARAEHAETDTSAAKQDNVQAMESESKATGGERDADVEQENREEFTDANEGNDGEEETDRSAKAQKHQLRPRDETNKDTGREDEALEDAALEADQPKTTAADENIDVEMGDVEPTADEEDLDENSDKLAHIGDQDFRPQDKHVVTKSTVEEALSTRSQFDRMKNKDTLEKVHRDKEVNGGKADNALDETEANEVPISDRTLPSSMINMNFEYELTMDDDSRFALLRERLEAVEISASERKALESKWAVISDAVSTLSFELAENLRIILEPTVASKLQGDYRTGKRLNMRRLVAYIASDYRKNRIWMRRTKKAQRNYQICLAVDDSASMKENLMTEMTCEAVCLIERALRQLEVGELSICKFGTTVKVLSEFTKGFDEALGPRLLEDLSFEQDKTDLANLLGVMDEHFAQARDVKTSNQMLIILGDGRGVLADGLDRIRTTLSRLMDHQVTVLYVIVDNHEKSITEMKVARFIEEPGQPGRVSLTPYMSQFPFPFYALIRNIASLPSTIAEAIRQWFEMTIRD